MPNGFENISACFSPGVNKLSGFEKDCAARGMPVFLADASVDGPAEVDQSFVFRKMFVGAVSATNMMTMDEWVTSSIDETASDLLLQIDVEGYEYETFLSMSDALLRRFRIIVVEFHTLGMFWSRPFFALASRAFYKLLGTHTCVHVHPNNCCGLMRKWGLEIPRIMEFTFLRQDRVKNSTFVSTFPHPLDFDNTKKTTLPLPKCWYGQAD